MSFSLIAVSDIHLDEPSLFDKKTRKNMEELKKNAFRTAVETAIEKNVSVLVICGDLYDQSSVSFETLIFLRKCFLDLANSDIKVCYAHGDKDRNPAPDIIRTINLVEFAHEVETYHLTKDGVPIAKICASGYAGDTSELAEQFEQKDNGVPTVGLLYEPNLFSRQGTYIQEVLESRNYDLFVLGGYHQYIAVRPEKNIIYTGSPTGIWFEDKHGGILYAEISDDGRAMLDKITVSDVNFHDMEILNIPETDINSLKRRIEVEAQGEVSSAKNAYLRVTLSGKCAITEKITEQATELMSEELSETLGFSVYVEIGNLMPVLPPSLINGTSPLSESIKIVETMKNDEQKFDELIQKTQNKYKLFYRADSDGQSQENRKRIIDGLIDKICKVMIREDNYED